MILLQGPLNISIKDLSYVSVFICCSILSFYCLAVTLIFCAVVAAAAPGDSMPQSSVLIFSNSSGAPTFLCFPADSWCIPSLHYP